MSECSQAQELLLAGTGLIHELPEEIQQHVEDCEDCRAFALKRRRLRRLAKSTQEIVRKDVDLSPTAWARIRAAVEDEAAPEPMMSLFLRWFPVAALPVLVIALGWALLNQDSSVTDFEGTTQGPAITQAQESVVPVLSTAQGEFTALEHKVGGMMEAGNAASVARLAVGHRLEFQPHSKVEVMALSETKVALKLRKGSITCEVRKLRADETFEVHANGMRVAVVGTRFTVTLGDNGKPSVAVSEGRVSVRVAGADEEMLEAGERYEAPKDSIDEGEPQEPLEVARAATDVSGVPVMRKSQKTIKRAPKKVPGPEKGGDSDPKALVVAEASENEPKVIEVSVTETMAPIGEPGDVGIRSRLVGVIGMIRSGNCSSAQTALKAINLSAGSGQFRSDITYLSGYCYRKQGDVARASRLFELYAKLKGSRRWKVPTSMDEVLPIPSPSHLGR